MSCIRLINSKSVIEFCVVRVDIDELRYSVFSETVSRVKCVSRRSGELVREVMVIIVVFCFRVVFAYKIIFFLLSL